MLVNLDKAVRKSGLTIKLLPGWETNKSNGGEDYQGVLVHHTGSFDAIADPKDDLEFAMWMAFTGRSDLPPPLDNLALSAEGVVYVSAAGNANHAGEAKASGPMPAAPDGGKIYIGIEAMNNGSQGWDSKSFLADGTEITYFEAYALLCASLCHYYGWPASHVRAHKETSVTGKWDPGLLDMDKFRARIAAILDEWKEEDMALSNDDVQKVADAILHTEVRVKSADGSKTRDITIEQAIKEIHQRLVRHAAEE